MVGCGVGVDGGQTGGGAGVAAVFGDCDVPVGREEADYCAGGVGLGAEGSQSCAEDEGGAHGDVIIVLSVCKSAKMVRILRKFRGILLLHGDQPLFIPKRPPASNAKRYFPSPAN